MKTTIKIEVFGHGDPQKAKRNLGWNKEASYVAKIKKYDYETGDFDKIFIMGYLDYSHANSVGSRGIYKFYFVDDGLYEVNSRVTWKRIEHYFLLIEDGKQTKMSFEEAVQWLATRGN